MVEVDTQYWQITDPGDPRIKEAARIIRKGGLVAFPTETVYGLGANGLDEYAVKGIYRAKKRPADNPLILHVSSIDEARKLAAFPDGSSAWSEKAERVAESFWPGPLSMVLPAAAFLPPTVTAGLRTVAIRYPANPIASALIQEAGVPIAAPSANTSGKPSPTQGSHVLADLNGRIDLILDGGSCQVGIESTILDLSVDPPVILRPGDITRDALRLILGEVHMDETQEIGLESANPLASAPKAPGMKYTHYAPDAPMLILSGTPESVADYVLKQAIADKERKTALLLSQDTWEVLADNRSLFERDPYHYHCLDMGVHDHPWEMGSLLYQALRSCDLEKVDMVLMEACPTYGQGQAVFNRIWKASGGRILYLS